MNESVFNAAQPGVGRVQVLGIKKLQTDEPLFGTDIKIDIRGFKGANRSLGVLSLGAATNLEPRGP